MRCPDQKDADPLPSAALLREREAQAAEKARVEARVEAMAVERGVTPEVIEREIAAKVTDISIIIGDEPLVEVNPLPSAALVREREAKAAKKARVEAMAIERGVTPQVIEREERAAAAKAACCCCAPEDGAYVWCCVPTKDEYILAGCLHLCLCPQQRCDPQCEGEKAGVAHFMANIPPFWLFGFCAFQSPDHWASDPFFGGSCCWYRPPGIEPPTL